MTCRLFLTRLMGRCVLLGLSCWLLATVTQAQDWSVDAPTETAMLLDRLRAAERRIDQLEHARLQGATHAKSVSTFHLEEAPPTDTSLGMRLQDLEDGWNMFTEAEAAKRAAAAKKPTFQIGGRIHFDTLWFPNTSEGVNYFENPLTGDDPEDRLFFRRIRLEMRGDALETMLWRIQIDFNTVEIAVYKDVYIGFKELPHNHTILVGNQKRPLGLDHLNSSRFNLFMERPLVVEAFNPDARRIGIGAYTYADNLAHNLRYGVFMLEDTGSDGKYIGDSLQMSGNFRWAGSPWYDEVSGGRGYFHAALAGMVAHPDGDVAINATNRNEGRFRTRPELRSDRGWIDTIPIAGANWYEIVAVESIVNVGPLQIVGEYMTNWLQRDNVTSGTGPDLFFHGGYIYVHYMLTGEHVPYNRLTSTLDRLQPFENFFWVDRLCGRGGTSHGGALVRVWTPKQVADNNGRRRDDHDRRDCRPAQSQLRPQVGGDGENNDQSDYQQ